MKTIKTKWLPAILHNLRVVCVYFLSDEELFSEIRYKMCFPLSRANAENNVFRKTVHLSSVWRKHFPCMDRSTTGDENSDGSDDSWRSWNGPGILVMVGDVVLSSDDRTTQQSGLLREKS